ncbi:hypothetical protein D3C87_1416800 [compost metagenome]
MFARLRVPVILAISLLADDSEKVSGVGFRRYIVPGLGPIGSDPGGVTVDLRVVRQRPPPGDLIGRSRFVDLFWSKAYRFAVASQANSIDVVKRSDIETCASHDQRMIGARHDLGYGIDRTSPQVQMKSAGTGFRAHPVLEQALRPSVETGRAQAQHFQSGHATDIQRVHQGIDVEP